MFLTANAGEPRSGRTGKAEADRDDSDHSTHGIENALSYGEKILAHIES